MFFIDKLHPVFCSILTLAKRVSSYFFHEPIPNEIMIRLKSQYNKLSLEDPLIEDVNQYFETTVYYMRSREELLQKEQLIKFADRLGISEEYASKLIFRNKRYISIKITGWKELTEKNGDKIREYNIEVKIDAPHRFDCFFKQVTIYLIDTYNYKLSLDMLK